MTYFPLHNGLKKGRLPLLLRNTYQELIICTDITKGWPEWFNRELTDPTTKDVLQTIEVCKGNIVFYLTATCWKGLSMCPIRTLRGLPAGYLEEVMAYTVFRARLACRIKMHPKSPLNKSCR